MCIYIYISGGFPMDDTGSGPATCASMRRSNWRKISCSHLEGAHGTWSGWNPWCFYGCGALWRISYIHTYNCVYIYIERERYTYTWHTCKSVKTPKLWCFLLVRPRNERLSGGHIMPTFAMLIHIYSSCLFFPIARCVYHVGQICAALARNWCLEALHQVPNPQRFVIILRWFAPAWGVSNTWEAVAVGEGTSGGTFLGGRIGGD